jgi:hypothetical protein
MAIWHQASSLATRETVWISTNVVKNLPQLNSHRSECYARSGIDGFCALEIAGMHTEYIGNDWQSKIVDFQKKWNNIDQENESTKLEPQ